MSWTELVQIDGAHLGGDCSGGKAGARVGEHSAVHHCRGVHQNLAHPAFAMIEPGCAVAERCTTD